VLRDRRAIEAGVAEDQMDAFDWLARP